MADKDNLIEVGVAQIDITPDYPIRLNGYGSRRTESEGIVQRIWAKALAIGSDDDGSCSHGNRRKLRVT